MNYLIEKLIAGFKELFKSRLDLSKGTRFTSLVFIALAMIVATGVLFAANTYYDLDTQEIITEEVQRATELTRATGGLIAGGSAGDTLSGDVKLQVSGGDFRVGAGNFTVDDSTGDTDIAGNLGVTGTSSFADTATFEGDAVWYDGASSYAGFDNDQGGATVYSLPGSSPTNGYVMSTDGSGNLQWVDAESTVSGDIT
ncbi:MAG: hypothetical protein V5A57_01205, partial [Candidatus Paceibacterota bacterium]